MMDTLKIRGGVTLNGEIRAQGAKNSVLPILVATLLGKGVCVIENCPDLEDVRSSMRILRLLGCAAVFEGGTLTVDSTGMTRTDIPECMMREMRSSVIFLGAILARAGRARISYPGGCELGARPIDIHLSALRALGAEITEKNGDLECRAAALKGREIILPLPSVGATEHIMIASCACDGVTHIKNAACEPEIEDLQNFLTAMGARVRGAGTPNVTVEGGAPMHGAKYSVMPDRIAAVTYLSAVAVAGGRVKISPVVPEHLASALAALSEAGCGISAGKDYIAMSREKPLCAIRPVHTMPYPGFPTDAQSPLMAMCTKARGTTVFVENIFDNRFRHAGELARMGADIRVEGRVAVVTGVEKLYGAPVACTDLRGGAALVAAALGAEGETVISELYHIKRGYENIERNLKALGAVLS